MGDKKRQHYVPRFYLKNFSIDDHGKAIAVFNIKSRFFIPQASLREQAYVNYFYGEDNKLENALSELEGLAAPVIRNIIDSDRLSTNDGDRITLLVFTIFLNRRTLYASQEKEEMVNKLVKSVYSKDPRFKDDLDNITIKANDPGKMALDSVSECLPIAFDLRYKLLINQTSIAFLASDNPVIYYNQLMEIKRAIGSNTGLASKGLLIFLPLSPRYCVLFYDHDVYKVGSKKDTPVSILDPKDAVALNELQCIRALENLYFNQTVTQPVLEKYIQATVKYRRRDKIKIDEFIGPSDEKETNSLLHIRGTDIECKLQLSFLKTLKKAKHYDLGNRVLHVRDEAKFQALVKFLKLEERSGENSPHFPEHLKHKMMFYRSGKK